MKQHFFKSIVASIVSVSIIGSSLPSTIRAEDRIEQKLTETTEENKKINIPPVPQPKKEVIAKEDIPTPSGQILAEEPAIGEVVSERTANSELIYEGNGIFKENIYFDEIHRKKQGKKQFEKISSGIVEDASDVESLETENTAIETKFKKKMKNGKYATFTSNGHKLTFSILQASGENKPTLDVTDVSANYKKKNNKIVHKGIFPDTDLRNLLFDKNVKEDLVLHQYNGYNQYTFKIETDLIAEKTKNGDISFVDNNDKVVFKVPAPTMTDSNVDPKLGEGAKSDNLSYSFKKIESGYKLVLTADDTWLKNPDRRFPIHIDPPLSIDITTDTYVTSLEPDSTHASVTAKWNESLQEYVLPVGYYGTTTGTNYAFLKHNIAPVDGMIIKKATFKVYVPYATTTPTELSLDRVDEFLSPANVTWNTKPTSTNIGVVNVGDDQPAIFDVTSTVKGFVERTIPNNGFRLSTTAGKDYWKKVTSSATANVEHKPRVIVEYEIPPAPGKVQKPTVQAFNNPGDATGYLDLSWAPVSGATSYKVYIFNGKNYTAIPVGNVTSYSTKDKGIWPTEEEIEEEGRYLLHTDKLGEDLPIDPRRVYTNGFKAGGEYGDYSAWTNLFVYVAASNGGGDGPGSEGVAPTLPLETPIISDIANERISANKGSLDLTWKEVPGAEAYKVWLFNGSTYQEIVVNETNWTSLGAGLFPTQNEIEQGRYQYHLDGTGEDLNMRPWSFYKNAWNANAGYYGNYSYHDNYFVSVSAYVGGKESNRSNTETPTIPTINKPEIESSFIDTTGDLKGNIDVSWFPVDGATGYKVTLKSDETIIQTIDVKDETKYTIQDLSFDLTNYVITISAYDGDGNISEESRPEEVIFGNEGESIIEPFVSENETGGGFKYKAGDILVTKNTNPQGSGQGLLGHTGIVLDSKYILHHSGWDGERDSATIMTIEDWKIRYKNNVKGKKLTLKVVRPNDSKLGAKAAQIAKDTFYKKNISYKVTTGPTDIDPYTYCSELVWYSYWKAGKEWKVYSPRGVYTRPTLPGPYDFVNSKNLNYNKFKIVASMNWK